MNEVNGILVPFFDKRLAQVQKAIHQFCLLVKHQAPGVKDDSVSNFVGFEQSERASYPL
jgi:hypothetical protein